MPISITNFFLNEQKVSILYIITLSVLNFKFCSKCSTDEPVSSGRPYVFVSPATLPNCPNLYKLKAASRASAPTKKNSMKNPEENFFKKYPFRHRYDLQTFI